jgi:hypothetical protein
MDANNNHNGKVDDFPEARASFTVKYIDASGFESMLTLRATNGMELLEKASVAINYLVEQGATPWTYYRNNSRSLDNKIDENIHEEVKSNGNENPAWCLIHECQMKKWEKNERIWYSHKVDGKWCNGK